MAMSAAIFQKKVDDALSGLVAWGQGDSNSFPLDLLGEALADGVDRLKPPEFVAIRNVSKRVSADPRVADDPIARHVLAVIAHAGSLSYSDYISESLLDAPFAPQYAFDTAGLRVARLIALLKRFIFEESNRKKEDLAHVKSFLQTAEDLPLDCPALDTTWLRWTLMPRSDHVDERWFMRVVQGTHLAFSAVTELEQQASALAGKSSWQLSAERIEVAGRVMAGCKKLVGTLPTVLEKSWIKFRDSTLPASADQDLPIRLAELTYESPCQDRKSLAQRHLGAHTPAPTLATYRAAAPVEFVKAFDLLGEKMSSWYRVHLGVTRKLNSDPGVAVAVQALKDREPHYLSSAKRRLNGRRTPPPWPVCSCP
jgi:hypothetical protein